MTAKFLSVEQDVLITAGTTSIWKVLTDPAIIKKYLFGSEVASDWLPESTITFTRESNGTIYTDKGKILMVDPGRFLQYSYWSSQEGYPDIPENYSIVSYRLAKEDTGTRLTYRRENIPLEFEQKNQERFLPHLLQAIKNLAEEAD